MSYRIFFLSNLFDWKNKICDDCALVIIIMIVIRPLSGTTFAKRSSGFFFFFLEKIATVVALVPGRTAFRRGAARSFSRHTSTLTQCVVSRSADDNNVTSNPVHVVVSTPTYASHESVNSVSVMPRFPRDWEISNPFTSFNFSARFTPPGHHVFRI